MKYITSIVRCTKCGFSFAGWNWDKSEEQGKQKMRCPVCGNVEIVHVQVEHEKEGE